MTLLSNDIHRDAWNRPRLFVARFLMVGLALASGYGGWALPDSRADDSGAKPPKTEVVADQPPNVLFIAVDDLNDWVGCLGEKQHWRKWMPREESTRSFLAVHVPGMSADGSTCDRTVGLIDIFPTLAELCNLEPPAQLQGLSFRELLVNPDASWDRPALTSTTAGNHTVRSEKWRYIRYRDGSEELYDHSKDPNEWNNLADRPELNKIKAQHAQWIDTLTEGEIIK